MDCAIFEDCQDKDQSSMPANCQEAAQVTVTSKMTTTNEEGWIVVMSRSQKRKLKLEELYAEMEKEIAKWEMQFYYDEHCSFCGCYIHSCGGDHGDEMREITRREERGREIRK